MTIENRGFNQFWVSENDVTFAVGIAEAARILNCTVEEARKVTFATVETLEVIQ